MKPPTRWMKQILIDAGIPAFATTVSTAMGQTSGTVASGHLAALAAAAQDIVAAEPRIGIILWELPCGCISNARLTTDPRHAGRVDHKPGHSSHPCDCRSKA